MYYLTNILNDVKLEIKNNDKKEKIYDEVKIDKIPINYMVITCL